MPKLPKLKSLLFLSIIAYLKGDVNNKVDFLHADKHESLLQVDTIILIRMVSHLQSSQNFSMLLQYLRK